MSDTSSYQGRISPGSGAAFDVGSPPSLSLVPRQPCRLREALGTQHMCHRGHSPHAGHTYPTWDTLYMHVCMYTAHRTRCTHRTQTEHSVHITQGMYHMQSVCTTHRT